MSGIVPGTSARSTRTAVASLPATGRCLASVLGAAVRGRLILSGGTCYLLGISVALGSVPPLLHPGHANLSSLVPGLASEGVR